MPSTRTLVPLFAVGVAAAGCSDDAVHPASWTATTTGVRLVEADGRLRLDREAMPRFLVQGADATDFDVTFRRQNDVTSLPSATERRGPNRLVTSTSPSARLDVGLGELCLVANDRGRCFPARWSDVPESQPGQGVSTASGPARLWLRYDQARALRQDGDTPGAISAWRAAADDARSQNLPREEARALRAAAFLSITSGKLTDAQSLLDRAEASLKKADAPVDRVRLSYYRAVAEHGLSRYREATRRLEDVARDAWMHGDDHTFGSALDMLAVALVDQGRTAEAQHVIADPRLGALASARGDVDQAAFFNNRGWIGLLAVATGEAQISLLDAVTKDLDRALKLAGASRTSHGPVVNRAWVALLRGHLDRAEQTIAGVPPEAGYIAAELIRGEIATKRGRLDSAQAAFVRAEALSDAQGAGLPTDDLWRAVYGQGQVAAARGDHKVALALYRRALEALDRVGAQAGVWHARARFHADRRPLVDDTIRLYLAAGDTDGALAVLDRANARALRALESRTRLDRLPAGVRAEWESHRSRFAAARSAWDGAREDGELLGGEAKAAWVAAQTRRQREMVEAFDAAEALLGREAPARTQGTDPRAIADALTGGQALVAFGRVGAEIHGFWLTAEAPVAHATIPGGTGLTASALLAPFRDRLHGIEHLYVVAGDAAPARELSTVEVDGQPLSTRISISDLPYAGAVRRAADSGDAPTLIVADPTADLPHAMREGRVISAGVPGSTMLARGEATRDAVRRHMARAGAMHYAGHGVARADSPWDAHLALADDTTLTVADILTVPVPPGTVVLSGCKTGVQGNLSAREALGLADAFIAAGSRAVLATRRNIPDEAAARFIARFHAEGGLARPGPALRTTIAAFHRMGDPIWSAFRLTGHP